MARKVEDVSIAFLLGALFARYFLQYPIVYFGWNYLVEYAGYANYKIPGFWVGMLALFVLMMIKSFFIRVVK
jgi:hypothetical protein